MISEQEQESVTGTTVRGEGSGNRMENDGGSCWNWCNRILQYEQRGKRRKTKSKNQTKESMLGTLSYEFN